MYRTTARSILLVAVLTSACSDPPTAPGPAGADVRANLLAPASIAVVMTGLESPRGLAFGPEGGLYVAESGTAAATGVCAIVVRGMNCYSGTGAISRLWKGKQERVASGLPSAYNAAFNDIVGPHHISFQGRGGLHVTIGWGGEPDARAQLGSLGPLFGSILSVQPSGQWRVTADVSSYEQIHNPGGGNIDSNPYGLLVEPSRRFVTDAGGNSLLEVRANGTVSLVAAFQPIPVPPGPFNPPFPASEVVPTQVRRGPDGALYVSTLTGAPFLPGAAAIYRVAAGQAPEVYAGGFTQVTDFAWSPDGSLYVLQYGSAPFLGGPGALIHVTPDGGRHTLTTALANPTGLAVGPDGALYVAHSHMVPGGGEVLRIVP